MDINKDFQEWLNKIISAGLPKDIGAIAFNIYEDADSYWSVELVGTESFDENDDDWACDEIYTTRETPYRWKDEANWESVLDKVINAVEYFMENDCYSFKFKKYNAIGVGFVSGDLEVIHRNGSSFHHFGIIENIDDIKENGYNFQEKKQVSIHDDIMNEFSGDLLSMKTFWENLDHPALGLAYFGVTLIPPESLSTFLDATIKQKMDEYSDLANLIIKANENNKWMIHYGI